MEKHSNQINTLKWNKEKGSRLTYSHSVRLFVDICVFFVLSCVCYVFVCVCLYVLCGHLLGKGWHLDSRLWCLPVSLSLSHWYPGSGVVLDCIYSWSLHPYLLCRNIYSLQDSLIFSGRFWQSWALGGWEANEVQCCQMSLYESDSTLLTHPKSLMTTLCISKLCKTFSPQNILV